MLKKFILVMVVFLSVLTLASASGICGDVNEDGSVNSYDLEMLNSYLFEGGDVTSFDLSDANGDRFLTIIDYARINQFINSENNDLMRCNIAISSCDMPSLETETLEDDQPESLSHDDEITLEELLNSRGYSLNVNSDQTNIQIFTALEDITLELRVLKMVASYSHVVGYYLNGDYENFVPLFEDADHPDYNLPLGSPGKTFDIDLQTGESISFVIDVYGFLDQISYSGKIYTENSLNPFQRDHSIIYDANAMNENGEYVIAFEDTFKDWEYQDIVFSLRVVGCEDEERVCGNSIIEEGEQCDDGNNVDDDQCSNMCTINTYCGDGSINQEWEQCDDGNIHSGDGCDAECFVEEEIVCYNHMDCGVDYDSGNFCSENSVVKNRTSYTCNYPGTAQSYCSSSTIEVGVEECSHMCMEGECHMPEHMCGDGIIQTSLGEECDERLGNGQVCDPAYGDSCSYCSNECLVVELTGNYCGDNVTNEPETCDDGNLVNGDGCSSQCMIETPSPICGNDIIEEGEQCDEGENNGQICNNDNGDCSYCSNQCDMVELEEDYDKSGNDGGRKLQTLSLCNVDWQCTGWSECVLGQTIRICEDKNHCGFEYNKPIEQTACELPNVLIEDQPKKADSYGIWLIVALIIIAIIVLLYNWNEFG